MRALMPAPRADDDLHERSRKIHPPDDRNGLPALVDAALIHYQFETIHAFADGNGRVGRMLITLHLFATRLVKQPVLYLSPALERRKDEYIDRMYNVSKSRRIQLDSILLDMVTQSCHAAIATADRLLACATRLSSATAESWSLSQFAQNRRFTVSIADIEHSADRTAFERDLPIAQLNVDTLVSAGVLQEFADASNPKFFAAREILDAISGADRRCPTSCSNFSAKKSPRACSARRPTISSGSSPTRWSRRGLIYEGAQAFATPRRLALHVVGLPARAARPARGAQGPARRRARGGDRRAF